MSASITHEHRVVDGLAAKSVQGCGDTHSNQDVSDPFEGETRRMTSTPIGPRRDIRPRGESAEAHETRLASDTGAAVLATASAAAFAADGLSLSLSPERPAAPLRNDLGALPVLSPATASEEASPTTS